MEYWYIILALPLLLSLINFNHWFFLRTVIKKHEEYISGVPEASTQEEKNKSHAASEWITSNLSEIKSRIKKSGTNIPVKNFMENAGLGFASEQRLNIIDNMLFQNVEILQQARLTLDIAKGYYLSQAKLCLSPLHWAEVLIYLPKELVKASGIELTSKFSELALKIVQAIYWVVLIAVTFYGFKP